MTFGGDVTWTVFVTAGAAAVAAEVLALVTEGVLVAAMTMIGTARSTDPDPTAVRILWRPGQLLGGGRGGCWYACGSLVLMGASGDALMRLGGRLRRLIPLSAFNVY
jgi:hypothetical protein